MSSTVSSNVQIGQNVTANLNIVLTIDSYGNLVINRGVYGGTLVPIGVIPNSGSAPQVFIATSGQTVFTLASTVITAFTKAYLNGLRLTPTTDYTISGAVLTLTSGATLNDELLVEY
jgi:hypothetical protein